MITLKTNNFKLKRALIHFSITIIMYFLISSFFEGNHTFIFVFFQIANFALTIFVEDFQNELNSKFYQFNFSIFSLISSLIINEFSYSWIYIVFTPISYFLAVKFKKLNLKYRFFIIPIFLALNYFVGFYLFPSTIIFEQELNNNKEIRQNILEIEKVEFYDSNNSIVKLEEGIFVLDFYTNFCGQCFQKFPDFDNLSKLDKYQKCKVNFYFVNVISESENLEKNLLRFHKYLPNNKNILFVHAKNYNLKELMISSYPTIVIIENGIVKHKTVGVFKRDLLNNRLEDLIDLECFFHY